MPSRIYNKIIATVAHRVIRKQLDSFVNKNKKVFDELADK